ncbi:discoidin domain-containing protein [Roseofilum sp. BLCC_M91]|uniref:Discoidin domain-containing protein n=1 Tax=Roseofilum halophilum BLCC-M91 TaxID=3022259 RepID=A0ABT7BNN2_9CYAN|nr:discoidin domain-containing protein [Roseofilum halophilum]MDJ1180798.1 discoidin domain-containing protein [Roseofilum halophilum BLCC-M91]
MTITQILTQFDFSSYPPNGYWVLLPPVTQDTRIKILNLKTNVQRGNGEGLLRWARPDELPAESPDNYAEKIWEAEWKGEHWRIDLYIFDSAKEVILNSLPIVNRGFPYDRDLLGNTSTPAGFDLQQGFGLKVKFVDNGFGLPVPIPGQFIAIFGTGQTGTDSFTTPQINVDASTSVTNTADGKTIKSGMLPKAGWELSGSESAPWAPGASYYEYGQGDLLYLIDGDDSTKWESATAGNSHDKKIQIHLGKEYQINGIRLKTGDFPHKLKGRILVSTDMGVWREVYPVGFLEGDINFAKVAARWVSIECKVTDNTPYDIWHLYEVTLFGDITQETEEANNPVISAFPWGIEYVYWGETGSSSPALDSEPLERKEADSYLHISPDSDGIPQLNYAPFNVTFDNNWNQAWTPSEKMTGEFSGIEIDLKQNYDIELIDAQFQTSPKQWRGHLIGSKDKQAWVILASGFISELRATAINFTQCRFLRIWNNPQANLLNGLSTPPRMNKFRIFGSRSMQQIEPVIVPDEPTILQAANMRLDLSGAAPGALTSTSGFSLVPGGTAPTLVEGAAGKHIAWRYPNNSTDMHLLHPGVPVQCILAEIRSPTPYWGHAGQSEWSHGGFFGGTNLHAFNFNEGGTHLVFGQTADGVRRNDVSISAPYDLHPIDEWFWLYIKFPTSHQASEWMLGRSRLSSWRVDVDLRNFLSWETAPSDEEIDEVVAFLS